MRRSAGLLLVAMSLVFIIASVQGGAHPAWGYARAFAEAAMVGGLADWFAVTAIFRRPLGLPIPHTAVIPRSKERIAVALSDFIADNFLAPANVAARLEGRDLAGAIARQCAEPRQADLIARGIVGAAPAILDALDDAAVAAFLRRQAALLAEDARLSLTLGGAVRLIAEQGRHQAMIDAAIDEGWRALAEHKDRIRAQVRARTAWLWRMIALDARASEALIDSIETTLEEMSADPDHPLRRRVTEALHRFAHDLTQSPELQAKVSAAANEIIAHPSVSGVVSDAWAALKGGLRADADREDSALRAALADMVRRFAEGLLQDEPARAALNIRLKDAIVAGAGRYGGDVSRLAAETIRSWDTATITLKLEHSVGRDLQYVRINGTVIGGLVGLALHQIHLMLPGGA